MMEIFEVKQILEALLFVSARPLSLKELRDIVKDDYAETGNLENILNELKTEYDNLNKPYEIKFVADGWTFATKSNFSPWIKKLLKEKTVLKLSPSALETLAMIAYKQPITRAEIDELRGVESSGVIDTLLERRLIKIVGRKEALGRPLLYGTTQEFLKHFGLAHLSELPLIEDMPKEVQQTDNAPEQELPFDGKGKMSADSSNAHNNNSDDASKSEPADADDQENQTVENEPETHDNTENLKNAENAVEMRSEEIAPNENINDNISEDKISAGQEGQIIENHEEMQAMTKNAKSIENSEDTQEI